MKLILSLLAWLAIIWLLLLVSGASLPPVPPGLTPKHPTPTSPLSVAVARIASAFKPLPVPPAPIRPNFAGFQVTLAWDQMPGAVYYNLYSGTNAGGPYSNILATVTNIATVDQLVPFSTNYFVATQVDTNNVESLYSSEVSWVAPAGAPSSWLVSVAILQSPDTITWAVLTNLPALTFSNTATLPQAYWRALMGITAQ